MEPCNELQLAKVAPNAKKLYKNAKYAANFSLRLYPQILPIVKPIILKISITQNANK
jgi:hypothetical protein